MLMNLETLIQLHKNQTKPTVDKVLSEKTVLREVLQDTIPWETISVYAKETIEIHAYLELFDRVLDEAVRSGFITDAQAIDAKMILMSWGPHWARQWEDWTGA